MAETQTTAKLAEALSSFQSRIGAIPRTREVKVETRSGGSYKFKYAPHEDIIEHIRQPLGEAGLSVSQHLSSLPDGIPALRTMLLHSSGERIEDVFPLPIREGMTAQELGSAVTYIRRYALSAILGLATDEDDDGNHAAGNKATFARATSKEADEPAVPEAPDDGSLIGTAELGKFPSDYELRQSPTGPVISFRLRQGRQSIKVVAEGLLAEALAMVRSDVIDQRVQCWGKVHDETFRPKGTTKDVTYQVLTLSRIVGPEIVLPSPEAPSVELFDEAELDAALAAV